MSDMSNSFDRAIWDTVASIPRGRVMSYGEVARAAGYPRHARMVSRAMSRADFPLPWYRVVRSDRTLAFPVGNRAYTKQKKLLEQEGVTFVDGKIVSEDITKDLDELLWGPVDEQVP